jgi:hypothetical protein
VGIYKDPSITDALILIIETKMNLVALEKHLRGERRLLDVTGLEQWSATRKRVSTFAGFICLTCTSMNFRFSLNLEKHGYPLQISPYLFLSRKDIYTS